MKAFLLICLLMASSLVSLAQQDISDSRADRETFKFDNIDYTVQQYLADVIKENTKCCGESSMTIKVEIDNTGGVTGVKPVDGDNLCYQSAIMEYVQVIKWKTSSSEDPEVIEFKIELDIAEP